MAGSSTEPKSYTRLASSHSCPSCVGMERECCALERARDELQSTMEDQIADAKTAADAVKKTAAADAAAAALAKREATAAHSRSLYRARLGTFIALVLSLLSTASLLFYMHSQLSEHEAVPVPERVFAWSGLVVGVVAVFYVATLVLSEGHCVKAARLLGCHGQGPGQGQGLPAEADAVGAGGQHHSQQHLGVDGAGRHGADTDGAGRHGADTDGAGHLYRAPIGFRCKPAGSWCADGIDSLAADMGLMRATYLDVYRVCRRVMCAVCLCLSVFAECPLFSLCTMYHVPNNGRYEQDSLQKWTWQADWYLLFLPPLVIATRGRRLSSAAPSPWWHSSQRWPSHRSPSRPHRSPACRFSGADSTRRLPGWPSRKPRSRL